MDKRITELCRELAVERLLVEALAAERDRLRAAVDAALDALRAPCNVVGGEHGHALSKVAEAMAMLERATGDE